MARKYIDRFFLVGPLDLDAVNRSIVTKSPINAKVDGRIQITTSTDTCDSTSDASLGIFRIHDLIQIFTYLNTIIFTSIHELNIFFIDTVTKNTMCSSEVNHIGMIMKYPHTSITYMNKSKVLIGTQLSS